MAYQMSRETLSTFKEDARESFCKKVINGLYADGYLSPNTTDLLVHLIELSKQADGLYLKSQATQHRYILLRVLLKQDHQKIEKLHKSLQQLPKKEELRLTYLDTLIDQQLELV